MSLADEFFFASPRLGLPWVLPAEAFFVQSLNALAEDLFFGMSGCLGDCLRKPSFLYNPFMTLLTAFLFSASRAVLGIACGGYAFWYYP